MRLNLVPGDKADKVYQNTYNADTVTIPRGTPVVLNLNGTNDGLNVVLPSTAGAAKTAAVLYGVATSAIPVNTYGDSLSAGYLSYALVNKLTRAASTSSWASAASIAAFAVLTVDTANNAFITAAATAIGTHYMPFAVLVDSIASIASSASATSDTRTVITAGLRAFVKIL